MSDIDLQPLIALGLTHSEAEIYAFLLENSPATGYRIAKGIDKQPANTYRALDSLHSKGAVIIDDSRTRLCRAVPVEELLSNFERRFVDVKNRAERELSKLKPSPRDYRVYQLKTTELVLSRFRGMLSNCQRVAVLDFFPWAVEMLRDDIIAAVKRGVRVTIKVYQPCELPGATVVLEPSGTVLVETWPAEWLNGIVDGREYLLALLDKNGEGVRQAVWSDSHFLGIVYYEGFICELMATELIAADYQNCDADKLRDIISKWRKFLGLSSAGYGDLMSYFG